MSPGLVGKAVEKTGVPSADHPVIDDRRIAEALYTATGLINPILGTLAYADPTGLKRHILAEAVHSWHPRGAFAIPGTVVTKVVDGLTWAVDAAELPGTPTWRELPVQDRADWWLNRVGTFTTALVAYPGVLGALANRLPLQDFLGFLQQAVLLCAVQREYGIHDRYRQADLLAEVLCDRHIDSARLLAAPAPADESAVSGSRLSPRGLLDAVRTLRSSYGEIVDELRKRPAPRQPWRLLSELPVIGAPADYVGERLALREAGRELLRAVEAR
ncbi:hypothetical protein [Williamsia sterculiae]|uniref:Uncharacterized protein n=1 Tax=Williamsia sterculiae TaxID=1344003 RepID=A0A1N7FRM3_9NOCA|nr:hypothetical protein [Williamsia sterculiae]SIS03012.1 hypothetical protein SAMN05445060_2227 [Williamsia sterculiae]